jgi:hypothetical protein
MMESVFKAVSVKNAVLWDVTLFGSCNNRRFGGMFLTHAASIFYLSVMAFD